MRFAHVWMCIHTWVMFCKLSLHNGPDVFFIFAFPIICSLFYISNKLQTSAVTQFISQTKKILCFLNNGYFVKYINCLYVYYKQLILHQLYRSREFIKTVIYFLYKQKYKIGRYCQSNVAQFIFQNLVNSSAIFIQNVLLKKSWSTFLQK